MEEAVGDGVVTGPVVPTIVMPHVVFPAQEFALLRDDYRRLSREAVAGNLFGFASIQYSRQFLI